MITIFIPVYNEREILERSVRTVHDFLAQSNLEHEILVVNNGSTDDTMEVGKRLMAEHSWFRMFELSERGVGTAFVKAINEASGEFVISLDADLSSDLHFVHYAADLLRYGDMVVGSKTMGHQRRTLVRVLGSQLYILFAQVLFDLTISDFSIGCKAYRKSAVLPVLDGLDTWTGYVFEICLALKRRGNKIIQIGVDCDDRRQSRFSLVHEGLYRYFHLFRCWRKLRRAEQCH